MRVCIELQRDNPHTFISILRSLLRDLQRIYPRATTVKKLLIQLEEEWKG